MAVLATVQDSNCIISSFARLRSDTLIVRSTPRLLVSLGQSNRARISNPMARRLVVGLAPPVLHRNFVTSADDRKPYSGRVQAQINARVKPC